MFVYDNETLVAGKSDLNLRPTIPANKKLTAAEWNTLAAALTDISNAIKAGAWHGLAPGTAPVAPAGEVRLKAGAAGLEVSFNGGAYAPLSGGGGVTLGAFDAFPHDEGASLVANVLRIAATDAAHPGSVSLTDQVLGAGVKTCPSALGLSPAPGAPVSLTGEARLRAGTAGLEVSFNGAPYSELAGVSTPSMDIPAAPVPMPYAHLVTLPDFSILAAGRQGQCFRYLPALRRWVQTGSRVTGSEGLSLTALANGDVLCVSNTFSQRYDHTTGVWALPVTMSLGVYREHTATLLDTGHVLVTGGLVVEGVNTVPTAACQIYNTTTNTWSATASMSVARVNHVATPIVGGVSNGMVLISGGNNATGDLASCELYNPWAGTFSTVGSLTGARRLHTATMLDNGTVLVAGGRNAAAALATCEVLSLTSWAWTPTGAMQHPRAQHTTTLILEPTVVPPRLERRAIAVGGGDSATELYEASTGIWVPESWLWTDRSSHGAVILPDGMLFVVGGVSSLGAVLSSCEVYTRGVWVASTGVTFSAAMGVAGYNYCNTGGFVDGKNLVINAANATGAGMVTTTEQQLGSGNKIFDNAITLRSSAAEVSEAGEVRIRSNAGVFEASADGGAWTAVGGGGGWTPVDASETEAGLVNLSDQVLGAGEKTFVRSLGLGDDPMASLSEVGGVRLRSNAGVFEASENGGAYTPIAPPSDTPQELVSDTGFIYVDGALGRNAYHVTTEDSVLSAPTNMAAGTRGTIEIEQGATAYALTFDAFWHFAGGVDPALTATPGAVDVLSYYISHTGTFAHCTWLGDSQ